MAKQPASHLKYLILLRKIFFCPENVVYFFLGHELFSICLAKHLRLIKFLEMTIFKSQKIKHLLNSKRFLMFISATKYLNEGKHLTSRKEH